MSTQHFPMCGRYTRNYSWREVHDFLDLKWPSDDGPPDGASESQQWGGLAERSYNVAPTQTAPVCVARDGRRSLIAARWGFRPAWNADPRAPAPINARSETAPTSPMFRDAFTHHRCLVPASGFYEWRAGDRDAAGPPPPRTTSRASARPGPKAPPKQPELFTLRAAPIFCFAGLWSPASVGHAPDALPTFTILTCPPNEMLAKIHDRMPVILGKQDFSAWLTGDARVAASLLRPLDAALMASHPVSTRVNSPRNNDPELLRAVEIPPPMPGLFA